MKLNVLKEARYAGPKSIENLLQFFEENLNRPTPMEHRYWSIRPGFVAKANTVGNVEVDVFDIEQTPRGYFLRPTYTPIEDVTEVKVYEMVRRY